MAWPISSIFRRATVAPARRSLEAARPSRRWPDGPVDARLAVQAGAATVAIRAADFALNSAQGARIADGWPAHLIGTGIVPRPAHSQEATRDTLATEFDRWAEATDFYRLQADLVRDMAVLGEALAVWARDEEARPCLRRLHPEQLDRSRNGATAGGHEIINGVEFDLEGRVAAYWIRPGRTPVGGSVAAVAGPPCRHPATDVVHMFRALVPGQVRGLSWFAPILTTATEYDRVVKAIVARVRVAALHAGFITDTDGVAPYDGEQTGSRLDVDLEPGALIPLPPGKHIEFGDLPDQGDVGALDRLFLRQIAAGAGVTYEMASGDYSQTNYSSSRAAMLEFRRHAEALQFNLIIPTLCAPAWRRFVAWLALTGRISAAAYQRDREQFHAVKWLPPAWPWVDPKSDAEAAILEMQNGLRSRSEIVAERGYDVEALDREIAADKARAERLGLAPAAGTGGAHAQ